MAPLEPYEKVYVNPSFLKTDHGEIACVTCHGGNPEDPNWQTAHKGVVKDPTLHHADKTCGECHKDIVATATKSLHYTLSPFWKTINARANKKDKKVLEQVCRASKKHCGACHGSCGQCHISRPNYVGSGFLSGHVFQKKPPMDTTCASCHGGRIYGEFTGANEGYPANVHYAVKNMKCMDCHTKEEMHADATGFDSRYDLPERPRCEKCHQDAVSDNPKTDPHKIHKDRVACQVCHAQANKSCFNCHVGVDEKGLVYFKNKETKILFKIGLNPNKTKDRPYNYVVLRHVPADQGLFDFYVKDGLADFDKINTWKLATPHNIQRITPQNKKCNNCHGNPSLFLQNSDLPDWEKKANAGIVVPEAKIPKQVKEVMK